MEDLHKIGGTPAVLKYLLSNGLIHGDCLTVTGKTLAENLESLPGLPDNQDIIRPLSKPIKSTGHIQILRGNLAPLGSVAKITGKEGLYFKGEAKVYDDEVAMLHGLEQGEIKKGHVVVIRYEGPKGGPGMPEMRMLPSFFFPPPLHLSSVILRSSLVSTIFTVTPTSAIMGAGLGNDVALLTDGRFSGGSHVCNPFVSRQYLLFRFISSHLCTILN
jgi:dihydroxy-acid dehydratase